MGQSYDGNSRINADFGHIVDLRLWAEVREGREGAGSEAEVAGRTFSMPWLKCMTWPGFEAVGKICEDPPGLTMTALT